MALFGISRRWNQTGQKYAGDPDISSRVLPAYTWLLWLLVIATYVLITVRVSRQATRVTPSRQMNILSVMVCITAFTFKVAFTAADAPELLRGVEILNLLVVSTSSISLVAQARIVFVGIAQLLAYTIYYHSPWNHKADRTGTLPLFMPVCRVLNEKLGVAYATRDELTGPAFMSVLHDLISLLLVTQSRVSNIPIFLIFYMQLGTLQRNPFLGPSNLTATSMLLQYSSFFVLGGSNAISSVDLSNAYNGITGYNVLAVGVLTFISNWAGPIWWVSGTTLLMSPSIKRRAPFEHFALLTLFTAFSTLSVMTACTVLREHLFIWTVFSPKFLFTTAWVIGNHAIVNGLFGYGLLGSLLPA